MKGWEIVAMATILVDSDDSMMFQMDSSWVSGHQSKAMGLPWMPIVGHGEQEQEVRELEGGLISGEGPKSVESWFEKGDWFHRPTPRRFRAIGIRLSWAR